MLQRVSILLFFCTALVIGVFVHFGNAPKTLGGVEALSEVNVRDPAALRKHFDLSSLGPNEYSKLSKDQMIAGLQSVYHRSGQGFELGHFLVKMESGEKASACLRYNRVVFTFLGDGMAVNGQLPKMEVDGPCKASADATKILPLLIPTSKILDEPVADGEFHFDEGLPLVINFSNLADHWPKTWVLNGVRLYNDNLPSDEVNVSTAELSDRVHEPVILNF